MIVLMAAVMLLAQGAADTTNAAASPPTAAGAPSATAAAAKPVEKAKADPDALVCHEEAMVGSRFPRKVCHTARGAAMRAQDDREAIRHVQDMTPAPIVH